MVLGIIFAPWLVVAAIKMASEMNGGKRRRRRRRRRW